VDKRLDFRFEVPPTRKGPVVALTYQEAEKLLLNKLDEAAADPTKALWQHQAPACFLRGYLLS